MQRRPIQKFPNRFGNPIPTPPHKQPKASFAKPALIGLFLIIAVIGFSFFKKHLKEKEIESSKEKIQQEEKEQKEKDIKVVFASPEETAKAIRNKKYQLVDIRNPEEFELKHIESSINIPLSTIDQDIHFIDQKKEIIIIDREDSTEGRIFANHLEKEGVNVKYLQGGILGYGQEGYFLVSKGNPALSQDLVKVTSLNAQQIKQKILEGELIAFVDTRQKQPFEQGHIIGAVNIPLEELERRKEDLPNKRVVLYDDNVLRSFQAAVRLYDMGVFDAYNSLDDFQTIDKLFKRREEE